MVAMFLAAFEGTVVSTAMPTIAKSLHGYNLISWVFSAYLLTSAISTPIYGKLSDLYGRKKILNIGIIIFLIGSSLCGFSQTMIELIIFRAIQGLGAGSIITITYTIIGDIFELSERAKIQGWLSTVWGIAGLIGPFLGGFIIDYLSWNWIFFVNIPFGLLSIYLLNKNLKETKSIVKPKIDYLGTVLLTVSIISILFMSFSTNKYLTITLGFIAVISLILLYFVEKKSEEPIIPLDIFTKNTVIANLILFLVSGILMAIESYTPIYTQNVLGFTPTISGLMLLPLSISWLLSSFIISKTLPKYGESVIVPISLILITISSGLLMLLSVNITSSILILVISSSIIGLGFGGTFTVLTITVQSAVGYEKRGVATSTSSLIRTLGQTICVSIFGVLLNSSINKYFINEGVNGITSDNIFDSSLLNISIKSAFFSGIHNIYIILLILSIGSLVLSLFLNKDKITDEN